MFGKKHFIDLQSHLFKTQKRLQNRIELFFCRNNIVSNILCVIALSLYLLYQVIQHAPSQKHCLICLLHLWETMLFYQWQNWLFKKHIYLSGVVSWRPTSNSISINQDNTLFCCLKYMKSTYASCDSSTNNQNISMHISRKWKIHLINSWHIKPWRLSIFFKQSAYCVANKILFSSASLFFRT
jgi:hypothetical protein